DSGHHPERDHRIHAEGQRDQDGYADRRAEARQGADDDPAERGENHREDVLPGEDGEECVPEGKKDFFHGFLSRQGRAAADRYGSPHHWRRKNSTGNGRSKASTNTRCTTTMKQTVEATTTTG